MLRADGDEAQAGNGSGRAFVVAGRLPVFPTPRSDVLASLRRHGLTWYLRQARATVASPIPSCLPNSRDDQWVTPSLSGGGSNVAAMIAASSTNFGRPLRGSSSSPAIPCAANRSRHMITVGRDTPNSRAVPEVPAPSATASTIRARST